MHGPTDGSTSTTGCGGPHHHDRARLRRRVQRRRLLVLLRKGGHGENFLWTTYGVADAGDDWDLAAIPSTRAPRPRRSTPTFRIRGHRAPGRGLEVLTYLLGDASDELLSIYGGMPARTADQDAFFETLAEQFPQEVDWQVAKDGVQYADNPNFEAFMPKYNQTLGALGIQHQVGLRRARHGCRDRGITRRASGVVGPLAHPNRPLGPEGGGPL